MRTTLPPLLVVTVILALLPASAGAQEIQWRQDYNTARREAEKRGLPIVLDVGNDNCFWCRKLDETTFRDPALIRMMNERFIPLKINGDRDPTIVQALGITSYPTIVLAGPDGKILGRPMEGYQDVARMTEALERVLGGMTNPDWMVRDYHEAVKAVSRSDHARAVTLLRAVLGEGKGRPIQGQAEKLLREVEEQGAERLAKARQLHEGGQTGDALEALTVLARDYAGTQTGKDANDLLAACSKNTDARLSQRQKRARELLGQAREFMKTEQFLACLDRCELLGSSYGDLPEGVEGIQMAAQIKNNTEWVQSACDSLSDRLSGLYLALAESWVRKGQTQQAVICLERIVRVFPGSRQAEVAQLRLTQLRTQSLTTRQVDFQKQ